MSGTYSIVLGKSEVAPLLDPVDRNVYIGWQQLFFTAFSDISMTTVRCYAGDNWAVSEIMLAGRNSRADIGNHPTGKKIEVRAGYLTRFDAKGFNTSLKLFIDSMVIMKQLGLEPVKTTTSNDHLRPNVGVHLKPPLFFCLIFYIKRQFQGS
jgi:hypothetical protein